MRDQSCRSSHSERVGECDRRALPASAVHARSHLQQAGRTAVSATESTTGNAPVAAAKDGAQGAVTIVTQTRVRPESTDAFARWQDETSSTVAQFPGFIKQTVMPPSPPAQADWVILQRFACSEMAVAWLNSEQRFKRIQGAAPMLVGRDDVHIVNDGDAGVLPSPASVVISTRIKPGQELAYRAWEQRIPPPPHEGA